MEFWPKILWLTLRISLDGGNATQKGSPEGWWQIKNVWNCHLKPANSFDFMVEHDLLDLLAKGKDTGGYCTYIADYQSPFIFANFNGTSADIDVLTQSWSCLPGLPLNWIPSPEVIWPTYRICEIHFPCPWNLSPGLGWNPSSKDQVNKYKFSHLASALFFPPYGVLVDHFPQKSMNILRWPRQNAKIHGEDCLNSTCQTVMILNLIFWAEAVSWFRQGHIFASSTTISTILWLQVCALHSGNAHKWARPNGLGRLFTHLVIWRHQDLPPNRQKLHNSNPHSRKAPEFTITATMSLFG